MDIQQVLPDFLFFPTPARVSVLSLDTCFTPQEREERLPTRLDKCLSFIPLSDMLTLPSLPLPGNQSSTALPRYQIYRILQPIIWHVHTLLLLPETLFTKHFRAWPVQQPLRDILSGELRLRLRICRCADSAFRKHVYDIRETS